MKGRWLGAVVAWSLCTSAHAQEDPTRPVGSCFDRIPRGTASAVVGIQFVYDSTRLDPNSASAIAELAERAQRQQLCVEVHTASRGDAGVNLALSRSQVDVLRGALEDAGAPSAALSLYGRGESLPIDRDDRTNARVIAWAWNSASPGAPSPQVAQAQPTQTDAQIAAVDTLRTHLHATLSEASVAAAVRTLGPSMQATFGDTYERRYPTTGVGLVLGRDGGIERVRLYGSLRDVRENGGTISAPSYQSELSAGWAGPLPYDLRFGAYTPDMVRILGPDAICLNYPGSYNALVYPALGLTLVIQPYTSSQRPDCRGRLAVVETSDTYTQPAITLETTTLGRLAGLSVDDPRVSEALAQLGPYNRVGQPPEWVYRLQGAEIAPYDGTIRSVSVYAQLPGRPILTGMWPWQGSAPAGLAWGASAADVAQVVGHTLSCESYPRSAGGETRTAFITDSEQAIFLLDSGLYEDASMIRARAPRGSCDGARLVGWRYVAVLR